MADYLPDTDPGDEQTTRQGEQTSMRHVSATVYTRLPWPAAGLDSDGVPLSSFRHLVLEQMEKIRAATVDPDAVRITLLIRLPGDEEGGLLISDDEYEDVLRSLRRMEPTP
jgi:hypothetical protein